MQNLAMLILAFGPLLICSWLMVLDIIDWSHTKPKAPPKQEFTKDVLISGQPVPIAALSAWKPLPNLSGGTWEVKSDRLVYSKGDNKITLPTTGADLDGLWVKADLDGLWVALGGDSEEGRPKTYFYDLDGVPRATSDGSTYWGKVYEQEDIHGADYPAYLFPKSTGEAISILDANTVRGRSCGKVYITGGQNHLDNSGNTVYASGGSPYTLTGGAGGTTSGSTATVTCGS